MQDWHSRMETSYNQCQLILVNIIEHSPDQKLTCSCLRKFTLYYVRYPACLLYYCCLFMFMGQLAYCVNKVSYHITNLVYDTCRGDIIKGDNPFKEVRPKSFIDRIIIGYIQNLTCPIILKFDMPPLFIYLHTYLFITFYADRY